MKNDTELLAGSTNEEWQKRLTASWNVIDQGINGLPINKSRANLSLFAISAYGKARDGMRAKEGNQLNAIKMRSENKKELKVAVDAIGILPELK